MSSLSIPEIQARAEEQGRHIDNLLFSTVSLAALLGGLRAALTVNLDGPSGHPLDWIGAFSPLLFALPRCTTGLSIRTTQVPPPRSPNNFEPVKVFGTRTATERYCMDDVIDNNDRHNKAQGVVGIEVASRMMG